jgi:hypothetical protein
MVYLISCIYDIYTYTSQSAVCCMFVCLYVTCITIIDTIIHHILTNYTYTAYDAYTYDTYLSDARARAVHSLCLAIHLSSSGYYIQSSQHSLSSEVVFRLFGEGQMVLVRRCVYMCMCVYVFFYVCLCVCVCVCL